MPCVFFGLAALALPLTAEIEQAVGARAIANFLTTITAAHTVNVDAPQTVGVINFNNANKYTLAGTAKITFANNGSAAAQINDANGSHQISAPIGLTSNLNVTVTNAADTMTISGGIPTATSSWQLRKLFNISSAINLAVKTTANDFNCLFILLTELKDKFCRFYRIRSRINQSNMSWQSI